MAKVRHSREACPREKRGAGIQEGLRTLDARLHGHDIRERPVGSKKTQEIPFQALSQRAPEDC